MTSPIPGKNRRITGPKLSVDPAPKNSSNLRQVSFSDDKILRDMPITAKDLNKIKKHYGIK
jgi:hypothetical protein